MTIDAGAYKELIVKNINAQKTLLYKAKALFEPLKELFYTEVTKETYELKHKYFFIEKEERKIVNHYFIPLVIDYKCKEENISVIISLKIIETLNLNTNTKDIYKRDNFKQWFTVKPTSFDKNFETTDNELGITKWLIEQSKLYPEILVDESLKLNDDERNWK